MLGSIFLAHATLTVVEMVLHEVELGWDELLEPLYGVIVFAQPVHARLKRLDKLERHDGVLDIEALREYGVDVVPDQRDTII